jgi:hypothetical protein
MAGPRHVVGRQVGPHRVLLIVNGHVVPVVHVLVIVRLGTVGFFGVRCMAAEDVRIARFATVLCRDDPRMLVSDAL